MSNLMELINKLEGENIALKAQVQYLTGFGIHALTRRVQRLIESCTYKAGTGWKATQKGGVVVVQHWQEIECCTTGKVGVQKGRKLFISQYMTDGEILRTLFLSVKLFEEHEVNECFKVDGERFLNPHPEGGRPEPHYPHAGKYD